MSAAFTNEVDALSTTPVFVYPLFIVLSALRLNFRLCVFTGAVAAFEYMLVGIIYIGRAGGQPSNSVPASVPIHTVKCLTLLLLGVITGLVALQIKKRLLDSFRLAQEVS